MNLLSRITRSLFLAGLLAFPAVSSLAQSKQMVVHFDPATTDIRWTLKANTHTVHGTFKLKGGVVTFDPASGVASGELLVDLTTGESGDRSRDEKMDKDVLEIAKYPTAFFHPSKISGSLKPGQEQPISAEGSFNIHGADHPLNLQLKVKLDGSGVIATTHFSVPYVAWGMKDPSAFVLRVAKEVDVDVTARGTIEELSTGKGNP